MVIERRASRLALALSAAFPLTGCDDGDRTASRATVRDSAGITIVENEPGGVWREGGGWTLSAEPALDIGVLDGDEVYQLHGAVDAVRLTDGRVVIANAGSHELRFYAPDGRHLRSVGRQGGGPGEFERIDALDRLAGDTLVVWDTEALRLSSFTPDGELVGSVSAALTEPGFGQRHYGTFSDGSFVLKPSFSPNAFTNGMGLRRDTTAYMRYNGADGATLDTIALTPGREAFVQSSGDMLSVTLVPFHRASHFVVYGDDAYAGVSDRFEIRVTDARGALRRIVRLDVDLTPVTDADVRLYAEANAAGMLSPDERDDPGAVRRLVQTIVDRPRPETFPMFDALIVDHVGFLWVREYERPGAEGPRHWDVFDPGGRLLGIVQMPSGFEVFEIGADFVLGHARDDLDIEHVRLYELTRSLPGPP